MSPTIQRPGSFPSPFPSPHPASCFPLPAPTFQHAPPNHRHRILTTRHFTTACRCDRFRSAIETALDTEPGGANELWCWRDEDAGSSFRICGMDLHGDILVEVVPGRRRSSRSEVTVHCREGDLPVLERLGAALGDELLRAAAAEDEARGGLPEGIASALQSLQERGAPGLVITDSAIESALECLHGGEARAADEIARLPELRRAIEAGELGRAGFTPEHAQRYLRRWPRARVALHRGEKVHLAHRLEIPDEHNVFILKAHFAYLPGTREHVVGWVDERVRSPFDDDEDPG